MRPRCGRFVDLFYCDRPLMTARAAQPHEIDFTPARERNRNERVGFGAMGTLRRTSEPHGDLCHGPVVYVMGEASEVGDCHAAVSSEFEPM